jgi:LPXTG-site transpeptidase (sortase) family protein
MNNKFKISIGILFILAGFIISSGFISNIIGKINTRPAVLGYSTADSVAAVSNPDSKKLLPVYLEVPTVEISIGIDPGYYDYSTNTWTLSESKASFAVVSSMPNAVSGNTYIYGHNKSSVFASMDDIKTKEKAIVTNAEGRKFTYKLSEVKDVSPSDLTYLRYRGKPILTLQTCHGLWDQYRRLYIFSFESATNV